MRLAAADRLRSAYSATHFQPERFVAMIIEGVSYTHAELGVDGNAGFALLGPDLQRGESEFVTIECALNETPALARERACKEALQILRTRLGMPQLPYYFGQSYRTIPTPPSPRL